MSQLLGQTPGSSRSVSYHQPRPSSGVGIFTAAPGASFLFTEGKGFREENPALSPKVDPRPVGLRGGGKRWVLTSQSRESGATAMQASWGPSSASRCLRNVLSWELPRSFPHHPQPLIPSYACSSTAFTTTPPPFCPSSFISPWEGLSPLSLRCLATVHLPLRLLKGSLEAGALPLLQTPWADHVGCGGVGKWEPELTGRESSEQIVHARSPMWN